MYDFKNSKEETVNQEDWQIQNEIVARNAIQHAGTGIIATLRLLI